MALQTSRQDGILDSRRVRGMRLLIIGAGGIGSNLFHTAISSGFERISLVDYDKVAEENIAPGWFAKCYINTPKVDALAMMADDLGVNCRFIKSYNMTIEDFAREKHRLDYDIIAVCTDSLDSRQQATTMLWERLAVGGIWFDGRMGGTGSEVHIVVKSGDDVPEWYLRTLRGKVRDLPCGEKATAPVTKGIIPARFGRVLAQRVRDITVEQCSITEDLTYHEAVIQWRQGA